MKLSHLILSSIFAIPMLTASLAAAEEAYLTHGHVDLGIFAYAPGSDQFEGRFLLDSGAVVDGETVVTQHERAIDDIIVHSLTTTTSYSTQLADALGISGGQEIYRLGNHNHQPNLGFDAYGLGSASNWDEGGFMISLVDFTGPGEMAVTNSNGRSIYLASRDGATTVGGNAFGIEAGDHLHYAWWFSAPGYHEATLKWEGIYTGGDEPLEVEGYGVLKIQVGPLPIPEPSSAALCAIATAGAALWKRKRKI